MDLGGQYGRRGGEAGYAMAALLGGLAVMSIGWLLVMPVWKQTVQREKEAELIFRAGQYARAVALFQRKYANAFPPSVDVLLREKMLRKKYLDPITKGEFRYLSPLELQAMPGITLPPGAAARPGFPQPPGGVPPEGGAGRRPAFGPTPRQGGPTGGIAAVVSRSTAASIKVFKNRRSYNQWVVTVEDVMPRRGLGIVQPGQQPGQPPGGQRGTRPGFPSGTGSATPSFPQRQVP
jgi:hypothetical protein